jgi:hypothetical protein
MTEKVDRDNVNIIVHEKYEVSIVVSVNFDDRVNNALHGNATLPSIGDSSVSTRCTTVEFRGREQLQKES